MTNKRAVQITRQWVKECKEILGLPISITSNDTVQCNGWHWLTMRCYWRVWDGRNWRAHLDIEATTEERFIKELRQITQDILKDKETMRGRKV